MSNVNTNITVEANLISPPTYISYRGSHRQVNVRSAHSANSCLGSSG